MKTAFVLALLLSTVTCNAQFATLTGTVTDSDALAWSNAKWTYDLINPTGFQAKNVCNGSSNVPAQYVGTLNSAGVFSGTVDRSDCIAPAGTTWRLTLQPIASSNPQVLTGQFIGVASYNAGTFASAGITAPRFSCVLICNGYGTVEVVQPTVIGSFFYVTETGSMPTCNQWGGSSWAGCSGASAVQTCAVATNQQTLTLTGWYTPTFTNYRIVITDLVFASSLDPTFNFNSDVTSGHYVNNFSTVTNVSPTGGASGTTTGIDLIVGGSNQIAGTGFSGQGILYNPGGSTLQKHLDWTSVEGFSTINNGVGRFVKGGYNQTAAITTVSLTSSVAAGFVSGKICIFGDN